MLRTPTFPRALAALALGAGFLLPGLGIPAAKSLEKSKVAVSKTQKLVLRTARSSALDLEVGGELTGLLAGSVAYLTREDLLALPQVKYTVTDDTNFSGPTEVSGVPLEELARRLGAAPGAEMVAAICDDRYQANYSRAYIEAHHPLLVLEVNGKPPSGWPKNAEAKADMGPFLISQPRFTPSFKVLSNPEAALVPWGVVRVEFRRERKVLAAIAPRGVHAHDEMVQAGYRLAQQNCFRCHNQGAEGGTKAKHPWLVLAAWAATAPEYFSAYVRNPQKINPQSQMEGSPEYDDRTLAALVAYFKTFTAEPPPAAANSRAANSRKRRVR